MAERFDLHRFQEQEAPAAAAGQYPEEHRNADELQGYPAGSHGDHGQQAPRQHDYNGNRSGRRWTDPCRISVLPEVFHQRSYRRFRQGLM